MADPWNVVAAIGGAVSAAAAVATLVILVRTNAAQRTNDNPLIEIEQHGFGEQITISLTAINQSRIRWLLHEISIRSPATGTIALKDKLYRLNNAGSAEALPPAEYDEQFARILPL